MPNSHDEPLHFSIIEPRIAFALFDGARVQKELDRIKSIASEWISLYREEARESYQEAAPHLVTFAPGQPYFSSFSSRGWGTSWGIFIDAPVTMGELYKHLRHFLLVKDESNRELYFRFYDPRVLRVFLPTCTRQQLREFFGPIEQFILEDEDPTKALIFWLENGDLRKEVVDLTKEDSEIPMRRKTSIQRGDDAIV